MKRSAFVLLTALAVLCLGATGGAQQSAPYRILISNDDGVRAPGLAALAEALRPVGEVIIVAPLDNQSGVGQALTSVPPIFRDDITLPGGLRAIGLTATPA